MEADVEGLIVQAGQGVARASLLSRSRIMLKYSYWPMP